MAALVIVDYERRLVPAPVPTAVGSVQQRASGGAGSQLERPDLLESGGISPRRRRALVHLEQQATAWLLDKRRDINLGAAIPCHRLHAFNGYGGDARVVVQVDVMPGSAQSASAVPPLGIAGDRLQALAYKWPDHGLWDDILWLASIACAPGSEAARAARWHHLLMAVGNFKRPTGRRLWPTRLTPRGRLTLSPNSPRLAVPGTSVTFERDAGAS